MNKWMIVAAGAMLAMGGTAMAGPAAWCKGAGNDKADMSDLSSKDSRAVIKASAAQLDTWEEMACRASTSSICKNSFARCRRS